MNDIDMKVAKAESDEDVLGALQGVKMVQQDLRAGCGSGFSLAFLKAYYEKFTEEVTHRLTEIDLETVGRITEATGLGLSGDKLKGITDKITGDDAFAQVIRAANVYRERPSPGFSISSARRRRRCSSPRSSGPGPISGPRQATRNANSPSQPRFPGSPRRRRRSVRPSASDRRPRSPSTPGTSSPQTRPPRAPGGALWRVKEGRDA